VKGLDRYAAAKPPLTPWSRPKKNVHAIHAGPSTFERNVVEGSPLWTGRSPSFVKCSHCPRTAVEREARESPRRGACSFPSPWCLVRDRVERPGKVVGTQDRAVGELGDVDRPAEVLAVLGKPAFGEHLGLVRGAVLFQAGEHHPRADRGGAVPRAVLGIEK